LIMIKKFLNRPDYYLLLGIPNVKNRILFLTVSNLNKKYDN